MVLARPRKRVRFIPGNNEAKVNETSSAKTTPPDTISNVSKDVDEVGCPIEALQDASSRLSRSSTLSVKACRRILKYTDEADSGSHYVPASVVSPPQAESCAIEDASAKDTSLFLATGPTSQLPNDSESATAEPGVEYTRRQLSTHDWIVEIFGGRRRSSSPQKMRSHELPVQPRMSAPCATSILAKDTSNPAANLLASSALGNNVGIGGLDCLEDVAIESFTPPKVMARQRVVECPRKSQPAAAPAERHLTYKRTHPQPVDQPEADEEPEGIFNFSEMPPIQQKYDVALPRLDATRDQVAKKYRHSIRNKHKLSTKKCSTRRGYRVMESQHEALSQTPPGCHPDVPAYEARRQAHGGQDENYQTEIPQPPVLRGFVEIPPAPRHPLNGYSVVVEDTFTPRIVVRGFETPNLSRLPTNQ